MLPIYKKARNKATTVAFIILIGLLAGWWIIPDEPAIMFMYIIIVVALAGFSVALKKSFEAGAKEDLQKAVRLYERDCDPEAFVEKARPYVQGAQAPYDSIAFWFLSYYARGLYEVGSLDEARDVFEKLRTNLPSANKPKDRADAIISLVPTMRLMLGGKYALEALEEAETYINRAGLTINAPVYAYAQWEKTNLEAQRNGDLKTLAARMRSASDYDQNSWLVRSECAERESLIYRQWNMPEAERERLEFIILHGGNLGCAQRAKARFAEISMRAQAACRDTFGQKVSAASSGESSATAFKTIAGDASVAANTNIAYDAGVTKEAELSQAETSQAGEENE